MEAKKSSKADLEKKKGLFFEIGFLFALALVLNAFEWKTSNPLAVEEATEAVFFEEEDVIPITYHQSTPPPPPPAPSLRDIIEVVDELIKPEDIELVDAEDPSENQQSSVFDQEGVWEEPGEDVPFVIVEDMPVFPGGDVNVWLNKHVRYPAIAQENGITGRVFVKFIVNRDGAVSDAEVVRGSDPSLDREALRVINSMPKWIPGKQRGKTVRVIYTIQINFKLH